MCVHQTPADSLNKADRPLLLPQTRSLSLNTDVKCAAARVERNRAKIKRWKATGCMQLLSAGRVLTLRWAPGLVPCECVFL
ncbi:hypothetical protein QQF64_029513 [Cirrhinus molitorella]|uniref:Uncharacterized protein n=1 Tax=Cirrhinus molitorella TaxID=172907 RepID=A0ABR3N0P8_9TELE